MSSLSTHHLTWVSLTLDVWSLFTAAPAKRSHCSLPLMQDSSSQLLTLPLGKAFFKFIFNWRIITLQCCAVFCCTTAWISSKYMYILSFWNLPPNSPFQPSQHQVGFPMLYRYFQIFYPWWCVYVNATLAVCLPLLPLIGPQVLLYVSAHFLINLLVFLLLNFMHSLYCPLKGQI